MNLEHAISDNIANENHMPAMNMNSLVVELEHYRRRSEWLSLINDLHGRLAGVIDLPSMIEAFSVWLAPIVGHDLIAYNNPTRERLHLFCSCHGPERRTVEETAQKIFACDDVKDPDSACCWADGDFYVRKWPLSKDNGSGIIIVLRKDRKIGEYESQINSQGLNILNEPLQRAIEYENLYEQASRDALTGLLNRRVFEERLGPVIDTARRHGHPLTLACMDLDRFKQINDNHGHAIGDLVLRTIASRMDKMVRSCDLLVRMGGDEFMLIMPDTSIRDANILAERLCRMVEEMDFPVAGKGKLGVSIGLVEWSPELDKSQWVEKADEALYRAKKNGRSQVCTLK